ncbi:hypothetical protein [Okeania sp. SIO1I7]|uniref:hypothetical protein n=1 Tax=Okeania sp. SIO1I7 TaxID=2607772 RepID=UPI0013FB6319|nr:hypothetical protein [Okeania sp. SIO1I7]NET28167.1 hypothetical protein [Okeania sp. SIO1I7]
MSTLLLSWRKFFPEDIILSLPVEQSGTKQSQSRVIITVGWVKRQHNPTIYHLCWASYLLLDDFLK